MKIHELEAYLLASRPATTYSPFTQSVLGAIRDSEVSDTKQTTWQVIGSYVKRSTLRKAVALAFVILVTTFVGLSGYAYANGTNPFSLIKRWVDGGRLRVTYQDPSTNKTREFTHGPKRTYSDLAISAFAEVNLIGLLHFHAANGYTVPKGGIEHMTDPFRVDYISPRIGTIEAVTDRHVVLHLTYHMSESKMDSSRDIDERITVPLADFYYYQDGKSATVGQGSVGKVVEVFQDKYLRHQQHSGKRPVPVDLYSVFAVTHSLEAIKEATTTEGSAKITTNEGIEVAISEQDIYELGLGGWSEVCLGNGADSCPHTTKGQEGQNFFHADITPGHYGGSSRRNPNMIPFGEGISKQTTATMQNQLRHVEGKITNVVGDRITIKTVSGALWTFQYSVENQKKFAGLYGPLQVGQLLGGGFIVSVYDWDRRDFDNQYVFGMSRY